MGWIQPPLLAAAEAGAAGAAPCPRKGAAVAYCAATNSLYVFGGMAGDRAVLGDLWRLRMDTWQWSQVSCAGWLQTGKASSEA